MITSEDYSILVDGIQEMKPFQEFDLSVELSYLRTIDEIDELCISYLNGTLTPLETARAIIHKLESIESIDLRNIKIVKSKYKQVEDFNISSKYKWVKGIQDILTQEVLKNFQYFKTHLDFWKSFLSKEKEYSDKEVKFVNKIADESLCDELDMSFLCRTHVAVLETDKIVDKYIADVRLMTNVPPCNLGSLHYLIKAFSEVDQSVSQTVGKRIKNAEDLLEVVLNYKKSLIS